MAFAAGRIPVIGGTGANSTSEAIELTAAAKQAGAQSVLLVTPYYNKPPQEGLYQHFKTIAEAVEIPIILYNVPGRTGCDLLPETVAASGAGTGHHRPEGGQGRAFTYPRAIGAGTAEDFRALFRRRRHRARVDPARLPRATSRSPPTSRRARCTRCAPRGTAKGRKASGANSMHHWRVCTSICLSNPTLFRSSGRCSKWAASRRASVCRWCRWRLAITTPSVRH